MRRFLKILLRSLGALFVLLLLLLLLLNLPATQRYLSGQLENYLEGKLKTEVEIGGIRVRPIKSLLIEKVYIEDQQKDTLFYVKELLVDFDISDLWNKKVRFQQITLDGLKSELVTDEKGIANFDFVLDAFAAPEDPNAVIESKDTTTTAHPWEFIFGEADLSLKNIDFYYQDASTATLYDVKFQTLNTQVNNIDLSKSLFDMKQLELQNAAINLQIPPADTTDNTPSKPLPFDIKLADAHLEKVDLNIAVKGKIIGLQQADLLIENGMIGLHDTSVVLTTPILNLKTKQFNYHIPKTPELPGFDANHLVWENVHIDADSFYYKNMDIGANIHQLSLEDKKGLLIEEAKTQFAFTPQSLDLKKLYVKTDRSELTDENIHIIYQFLEGQALEDMYLNLSTTRANLAIKDILYFQPSLADIDFFKTYKEKNITVRTRLAGTFRDVKIPALDLRLWDATRLQGSGRVYNVLNTKKLKGLLKVNILESTGKNLGKWLPKGTLPTYVELPQKIIANGLIKGDLANLDLDLDIKTSRSNEAMAARLHTKANIKNVWPIEDAYFDIHLDTFLTTRNDLLSYLPPNILPEYISLPSVLALQGTAKGTVKNMISDLRLSAIRNNSDSYVMTSGSFKNLLDPNNLAFDMEINSLNVDPNEIKSYLPVNALPACVLIPFIKNAKGVLKGTFNDLNANLSIKSNSGELKMKGNLTGEKYDFNISVKDLIVKKLFDEQAYDTLSGGVELPPFTGTLNIKGEGLDPAKNLKARVALQLQTEINGQLIKGLTMAGDVTEYAFKGTISNEEEGLSFTARTDLDFNGRIPSMDLDLDLRKLDLFKMGLSKKPFYLKSKINASVKGMSLDTLDADITMDDLQIMFDTLSQTIDSIEIETSLNNGNNKINITSDFMVAFLSGQFQFDDIGKQLQQQMLGYFNLETSDTLVGTPYDNFQFYVEVFRPEILTMGFIPHLTKLTPFYGNGTYKSADKNLRFYGEIPSVTYMDVTIDSMNFLLRTDKDKFNYKFEINEINLFDKVQIYRMIASGDLQDKQLATQLKFLDLDGKDRFDLKSLLTAEYQSFRLQLHPEQLINYQTWQIPSQNAIFWNKDKINVLAWKLSNQGSFIEIKNRGLNSVDVLFEDFDLGFVSDILQHKSELVDGEINGRLTLGDILIAPTFETDLTMNNLKVIKAKLGDLTIKANNQQQIDIYNLDLKLLGEGNNVKLLGDYRSKNKYEPIKVSLDIDALNMASIEPFLDTYLAEMEGFAQGNIKVEGTPTSPSLLGEVQLKDAAFKVKLLNSKWKVGEEKIIFDANAIEFEQLTLTDNLGSTGTVSAYILTPNFIDYTLDLQVKNIQFLGLGYTRR